MKGSRIGSLVGAVAGMAFIFANSTEFASSVTTIVRVAGALAFLAVLWLAVIKPPPSAPERPPSRAAIRTYGFSVTAMVLAMFAGSSVISRVLEQPNLVVLWVIFVVGAHFLPFAKAFAAPVFTWLSLTMMGLAVVGTVLALTVDPVAAKWTAVATGLTLLLFSFLGSRMKSGHPVAAV
ncbi:hypothetical protein [Catelliglobosispora koreensis]|uniref:hypothetical protein n=1 Tax=Catelliglobosispora koreensis TaxID=129052 RepID=UPI0012F8FF62|nr:hypothetical protein [Catelliglobosispora koreensis]